MATVIAVRLHNIARQLWFDPAGSGAGMGDHVIVSTERGTEMGLACSTAFDVEESDLRAPLKPVLRVATDADLARAEELGRKSEEALPVFREMAKRYELDMKPLDVDFLFGGDKAIFYFTAEERVDFRALVRDLASEFHTRIDMRQIGVRDEAQLVGGIAHCGQELCCVRMGGEFKPVSIRMAKEQDLPLNPLKISGFCGRLMCCLRYEFDAYKDFKSRAPKKNALIETPLGMAKVIGFGTPRETVDLRLEDGKTFTVPLSEMGYADGTVAGDYDDHAPVSADKKGAEDAQGEQDSQAAHCCATASGKPPCPGRPCAVSRASLDLHGGTQIALALAAYDREHGLVPEEDISDDLIDEVRDRPKRRRQRAAKAAEGTQAEEAQDAQPRDARKRRQRRTAQGASAEASAAEAQPRRQRAKAAERAQEPVEQRRNPRRRHRNTAQDEGASQSAGQQQTTREKAAAASEEGASKRASRQRPQRRRTQQPREDQPKQQAAEKAQRPRPGQNSSGLRTQRAQGGEGASQGGQASQPKPRRRRRRSSSGGADTQEG